MRPLFVPVRRTRCGTVTVRTGCGPSGQPVGLAFTSAAQLELALGAGQPWIRLCEPALHELLDPLGIAELQVNPQLAAPAAAAARLSRRAA